jgi:Protein of unknown function (DUF4199)
MNIAIKYGIIAGVSSIAYYLLLYFFQKPLIFSPMVIWSSSLIPAAMMFLLGKKLFDDKKEFSTVLQQIFVVWIVASAMFYIWYYRFFNADPQLGRIQADTIIEGWNYMREQTTDIQQLNQIRSTIADLQQNPMTFTFKDALFGLGRGLIGGFIIAYVITYFLDRNSRRLR